MKWQLSTGYGKRAMVETTIGRYKFIIGRRMRARSFHAQRTEVAIGCSVLNRMLACARPKSVHHQKATAYSAASKSGNHPSSRPGTNADQAVSIAIP